MCGLWHFEVHSGERAGSSINFLVPRFACQVSGERWHNDVLLIAFGGASKACMSCLFKIYRVGSVASNGCHGRCCSKC